MLNGKLLSKGYRRAGSDFLANRLEGMFRILETPEDVALHNVVMEEVLEMVGSEKINANRFFKVLAHNILVKEAKQILLKDVVKSIFSVAKG